MPIDREFQDVQLYIDFSNEVTGQTRLADAVLYANLEKSGTDPYSNIAVSLAKIYTWADGIFDFSPSGTDKIMIKASAIPSSVDTTYEFREGSTAGAFEVKEGTSAWQVIAVHGVPTVDANGKILQTYIPSYAINVVEGYLDTGEFYSDSSTHTSATQMEHASNRLYVDIPTNTLYRWDGTDYVALTSLTDVFTGATALANGTSGLVPAPLAGDQDKFLKGDGTWADVPSAYVLPTASASTLGGVKVGDNLSIDANGVLSADDSVYTAGEGIRFSAGPSITTMTHIKWRILETRSAIIGTSNDDTVQIGEIEFYDENDTLLTFSAISGQFVNTSLTPTYNTDNYVKTPDKLIDGDPADKCCCINFTAATRGIEFIFELSTSMSPQDFKNYTWYTANDNSNCDPVTWQMYISDDGTDWVLVDERTRETIPTAREVSTEFYAITKPDANAQAINVKYGDGLSLDENGYLIATGTQLTAGQGIEIQNSTISDKLGVGLTYDNNDAITLDEATELVLNCDYSVS